jgi:uncharacterized membrane protein YhaH (DUF805 family)
MPNAIIQGFQSVAKFEGRDRRARFWPYVAVVVALHFVIQMLGAATIAVPLMAELQTSIETETEPPWDRLEAAWWSVLVFMAALGISYLVLMAAAVTRRLHDTGRTALWGLLPFPFFAYNTVMFWLSWTDLIWPDEWLFLSVSLSSGLGVLATIVLIVLLALPGAPEPNRFGARP